MTCGHFSQLAAGHAKQPSALILNSRILQSTPESGARAAKIAHRRPSLTMLLEANSGPGAGPDDQRVLRAHEPDQAHPMPTDFREELMARFHDGQPGTRLAWMGGLRRVHRFIRAPRTPLGCFSVNKPNSRPANSLKRENSFRAPICRFSEKNSQPCLSRRRPTLLWERAEF